MQHTPLHAGGDHSQIATVLPTAEIVRRIAAEAEQALRQDDIPNIRIDEGEMRQLLLNLVRNGIQAMPAGGTLTIKTFEDSHGVNLNIEDQGQGISPEELEKVGTPFFTTKDTGTGLGLAVCKSIAERHNATIAINTCSQGTVFKVVFPVAG